MKNIYFNYTLRQNLITNILSKAPNCTILIKHFRGACPRIPSKCEKMIKLYT